MAHHTYACTHAHTQTHTLKLTLILALKQVLSHTSVTQFASILSSIGRMGCRWNFLPDSLRIELLRRLEAKARLTDLH